jgi:4-oxalmesaconate hydratase
VRNPQNGRWFDDIKLLIDDIEWLTDADRQALYEDNAKGLFKLGVTQPSSRDSAVAGQA